MKHLMTTLMLATVMSVASTAASAQTLNAEIPFAFRAGDTVWAPGNYELSTPPGEAWFRLYSKESRKSIVLLSLGSDSAPAEWKTARNAVLEFSCGESRACNLTRMWTAKGMPVHTFATPKMEDGKPAVVALIRLVRGAAR